MKRLLSVLILSSIPALWISCSYQELMEALDIKRPQIRFDSVQMTGLSFDQADLTFTFDIYNPNGLGVDLAGFDYNLEINTRSFLSGEQKDALAVPARGNGKIRLPLSLKFRDLYALSQSLQNQDSSAYALSCGFSFDLPVLGPVRIPASHSGQVPNIKLPGISLKDLKVTRMNLAGADLLLQLSLQNPNGFSFILKGLDLNFSVNEKTLLQGHRPQVLEVAGKNKSMVEIPISVSFLQMGSAVYQMLTNSKPLNYGLNGFLDIQTALPLIGEVRLPLDQKGTVKLSR